MTDIEALLDVVMRLARYGPVRDRATEREPRTITITDDEAMLLLSVLGTFDHPLMQDMMQKYEAGEI
jgi:hypothetical protein